MPTATDTRERLIQDLREYRQMQEQGAEQVDRRSLDVAAEIVALYENRDLDGNPLGRRWQDELPALPVSRRRGPARDPDSFTRFTKWAKESTGLKSSQLGSLKQAHFLARNLSARGTVSPSGEFALRPLNFLVREDREDDVPKVWSAAVQLAQDDGRETPSNTHVKRALKDWKDANLPKSTTSSATPGPKGARAKVKRLEEEVRNWVAQEPTLTVPMLERVLADFKAKAEAIPPVSEWSKS